MKSLSGASDVPPGLKARNRISSCLKVVGLSTTRTPFDSVHSVMPDGLRSSVFDDRARRRQRLEQRPRADRVDVGRQRRRRCRRLITAASFASSGIGTPAFCGALTATTRLRSGTQSRRGR